MKTSSFRTSSLEPAQISERGVTIYNVNLDVVAFQCGVIVFLEGGQPPGAVGVLKLDKKSQAVSYKEAVRKAGVVRGFYFAGKHAQRACVFQAVALQCAFS